MEPKKNYSILKKALIVFIIIAIYGYISFPKSIALPQEIENVYNSIDFEKAKEILLKEYQNLCPCDIYIHKEIVNSSSIIMQAIDKATDKAELECKNDSWLFVINRYPGALFAHPITIGLINNTNSILTTLDAQWWPLIKIKEQIVSDFFESEKWIRISLRAPDIIMENKIKMENKLEDEANNEKYCGCCFKSKNVFQTYDKTKFPFLPQKVNKHLWALIICGHIESKNEISSNFDTDDMYTLLTLYKVPNENIVYLNPNRFKLDNDSKISSSIITIENIKKFITTKFKNVKENDKFLFFISTHGVTGELMLKDDPKPLTANILNGWLNLIPCKKKYLIINACSSGSFIQFPSNEPIIITSTSDGEISYDDIDNDCDKNQYSDRGNEFISGFIEAFLNKDLFELKKDKKISLYEAFEYAEENCVIAGKKCRERCPDQKEICIQPKLNPPEAAKNAFLFWD